MQYYLGKGTEFKKEECKEYKTLEGALKAAGKSPDFVVWDKTGAIVGSLTDEVTEGVLQTNPDGSVTAFDETGNEQEQEKTETAAGDEETVQNEEKEEETENEPYETEKAKNEDNTTPEEEQEQEDEVIVPQGTMRVTVICDGTLNLRRSAAWGNENICGRASKGQAYIVKEIHMVAGKKMVRTLDDIYLSGQPEHVKFEQI